MRPGRSARCASTSARRASATPTSAPPTATPRPAAERPTSRPCPACSAAAPPRPEPSALGQLQQELAQECGEPLALRAAEALEQARLVAHVSLGHAVDQRASLVREHYRHRTACV